MFKHTRLSRKASLAVLVLISLITCGGTVKAENAVANSAKPPLQGAVELNDTLPGLPDQYKVGSPLPSNELQGLTPDNVWFSIPNWFAGKWHGENKTVDYIESYQTGLKSSPHKVVNQPLDTTHGHQRDKTGQIWEFVEVPRWKKVGGTPAIGYLRILREDVLQSDPSQIILKDLHNQILVDDEKQTILGSIQVQQIGTYLPIEDGLVKVDAALKSFDDNGNPNMLQRQSMLMKRTSPFENIDSLDGLDLKKLFVEFLKKTGRQDLLPDKS
jgi:hypothetical protein